MIESIMLLVFIVIGFAIWLNFKQKREVQEKSPIKEKIISRYEYRKKNSVITNAELNFYKRLRSVTSAECGIIPQAHLSMFLNHTVQGQNWRGAFSVINGKSVDFLVCERETFRPLYAIELDDNSHLQESRITRDELVGEILSKADIPLIRFKSGEWLTDESVRDKINLQINPSALDR